MAKTFHAAAAAAHRMVMMHRSMIVSYHRGATVLSGIEAVAARRRYQLATSSGVTLSVQDRDWLLQAGDLAVNGVRFDPQPGDIIRTDDGEAYEVVRVDEDCFRRMDSAGQLLRVHTQRGDQP